MALTIGNGNASSFMQQGQVDWVQLSKLGVSTTVSTLARLSFANVDPFTCSVAQAISSQFKLSHQGQLRLSEALEFLKCFSSLGKVMWYGFGVKHVVHVLAQTTQGMTVIALCAGLSEVMSTEMAAIILDELARAYGAPEGLRPSLLQWGDLICTCAGTLASTNFGIIAEKFMAFKGDSILVGGRMFMDETSIRRLGAPTFVAKALEAVARLSTGSLTSIELKGGGVCGFIAAIGYWFLGLNVEIRSGDDVLYRNAKEDAHVHIRVDYTAVNEAEKPLDVQVTSNTYPIPNIDYIVSLETKNGNYLTGRVEWKDIIEKTFGAAGRKLIASNYHFGLFLGCSARIFAAVANSEPEVARYESEVIRNGEDMYNYKTHNEWSEGKGFTHFIVSRLPELANLESTMLETLEFPLARAFEELQCCTDKFELVCSCFQCQPDGQEPGAPKREFCIPRLAETILVVMRDLTYVHLDVEMQPYRAGLEMMYHVWVEKASREVFKRKFLLPIFLRNFGTASTCETAEALFTGMWNQDRDVRLKTRLPPPAFSHRGVTFYLDILRRISDQPGEAATLHVVPGSIQLPSGCRYTYTSDSEYHHYEKSEATNYQPLLSLTDTADTGSLDLHAELRVTERIEALYLVFQFSRAGQEVATVPPYDLIKRLSMAANKVFCLHRSCGQLTLPLPSVFTADGEGRVDPDTDAGSGRSVVVRRLHGNVLARCLALCLTGPNGTTVLRSNECLSCCIKSAIGFGLPVVYIV
ncbi:hypothetical protein MMC30_006681 [Trapelia coarctata]|nr:hypothetical protein [Trapelia coarctata]